MSWARRQAEDLVLAAMVLTRLPVGRWAPREPVPLGRGVWAYPLLGGLIGGFGGLGYAAAAALHLPPALAAGWTLLLMLLLTGALHEDGLADTADGFGGGRSVERKLEIMRDSRVGSFGVLALILSLGLRGAAIAALGEPVAVMGALVAAGALGRGAILLVLRFCSPARPDGLAALLGPPSLAATGAGLLLALAGCALLPSKTVAIAVILTVLGAGATTALARRQIGGHTGDVLGAAEQAVEILVLSAITATLAR